MPRSRLRGIRGIRGRLVRRSRGDAIDERDEIELKLYPNPDLEPWPTTLEALGALEDALNLDDPARFPEDWEALVRRWEYREQAVMMRVHHGFFSRSALMIGASFII